MSWETVVPLLVSLGAVVGAFRWLKTHQHPELVQKSELSLVRELLRAQHDAVLRELELLRQSLPTRRP